MEEEYTLLGPVGYIAAVAVVAAAGVVVVAAAADILYLEEEFVADILAEEEHLFAVRDLHMGVEEHLDSNTHLLSLILLK